MNTAEPLALLTGLREPFRLHLGCSRKEADSLCSIQWAFGKANYPWQLADIVEEVKDLSIKLKVSFNHINRSANGDTDCLAKEGIGKPSLIISSNSAMSS